MQRVREQVQVPEQSYSGSGRAGSVTVAVLDTGIAYHPDLAGCLLAFSDFVEGQSFPYDDNGHGTHVCGILCGSGELSGGRFRGSLWWERCWTDRAKAPAIPCRKLWNGYCV